LAEQDRTSRHARRQTAAFLRLLYDGLGQPPLSAPMRTTIVGIANLFAEQDLGRRWAEREAIADLIAAYGGKRPKPEMPGDLLDD
jgi:hypothetical protein